MSVLVSYLSGCCTHHDVLAKGENGVVLCLSADQRQARITLDYIAANFEQSPILAQLVVSRTADAIELSNGVTVEVRAASYRRLRGITAIAIVASEIAFWHDDETSSNPAEEILAAVRPSLSTTGPGPLLMISTPHRKAGALWNVFDRNFGAKGTPSILVARAKTTDFNLLFPQAVIDRALERDPALNAAEYLVEWRSDLEAYASWEIVRSCVDSGVYERMPEDRLRYFAFCDPAAGSGGDSMTLAIAHRQDGNGNVVVLDALREVRPFFNPTDVVNEFCELLRSYRVSKIYGDRFGGEWCRQPFRECGVSYEISDKNKGDLYQSFLPALNSGRVRLLDNQRLIGQIVSLERSTRRGGRDSIDHPAHGHDDLSNVAAGVVAIAKRGSYPSDLSWVSNSVDDADADAAAREFQEARFTQHVLGYGGYYTARRW